MGRTLETDVLVVGGGSRALILLERLASIMSAVPVVTLKVIVAEPGVLGPGLHQPDQAPYITFNSPSTCPTIFINQSIPSLASSIQGLSFAEWLTTYEGEVAPGFRPRAVAGAYLSWSAQHLLSNLPPNLRVEHIRVSIVRADEPVAGRLAFRTDRHTVIRARCAVIAVGHSFSEAPKARFEPAAGLESRIISNPFPTHVCLRELDRRHTVAIQGMGLTALDVLAELTIGRGGRFEPATALGVAPRYIASGHEPKMYMYSRSSCPVRARPDGSHGRSLVLKPVILTDDRAAQLLDSRSPIEFQTEVFPLILAEMAHRLLSGPVRGLAPEFLAAIRQWFANGGAGRLNAEVCAFFLSAPVYGPLYHLVRPIFRNGMPGTTDMAIAFLQEDIRESRLGVPGSTLKYALEALVEARVFVKSLVDFQGDRFSDTDWIYRTFSSLVNRNAIGPQSGKSDELLSLLRSALVEIFPAASSVVHREGKLILSSQPNLGDGIPIDYIIRADHINYATPAQSAFVQSLISAGLALPILDAHGALLGLKVDQGMRLISHGQRDVCPLWGTGPISEGSTYYNNYVPCIQADAEYPYFEADRIARGIFEWYSHSVKTQP